MNERTYWVCKYLGSFDAKSISSPPASASHIVDGAIPAVKDESGSRWVIHADDLDAIASHFLVSE
jgi:hypothetical protein